MLDLIWSVILLVDLVAGLPLAWCLVGMYYCVGVNVNGDSMRLRKVHGAKDLIAKHREYIIDNLDNEFIDLKSLFKKKRTKRTKKIRQN